MFLVSSCSCLRSIHWSQVLSWEWRCKTTSELSKISLPTKVRLILEVLRYVFFTSGLDGLNRVGGGGGGGALTSKGHTHHQCFRYLVLSTTDLGSISAFNTLRPRQNGRHFADDTFKRIFVNENVTIFIEMSLKFVPKGPINNIPALVQIMAWRRPGDEPLCEPMMVCLPTHICVTRPQWVNIALVHICMQGACWYPHHAFPAFYGDQLGATFFFQYSYCWQA